MYVVPALGHRLDVAGACGLLVVLHHACCCYRRRHAELLQLLAVLLSHNDVAGARRCVEPHRYRLFYWSSRHDADVSPAPIAKRSSTTEFSSFSVPRHRAATTIIHRRTCCAKALSTQSKVEKRSNLFTRYHLWSTVNRILALQHFSVCKKKVNLTSNNWVLVVLTSYVALTTNYMFFCNFNYVGYN